jgi:transposase
MSRDIVDGMKPKNLVIVRAVHDQGLTHAEAATRFGVTRQWVHTLVRRYETEGPDGVAPRSRAPKTRPGTTAPAIRDRIVELRRELTRSGADAGPVTIAWHLEHEGHPAPSTSTIRRILHTAGLVTPAPKKRPRNSYIRFQADLPNECWQADITH